MIDRLDAVMETAAPLLKRVDDVLASAGAPPDHGVWPPLRRIRLLPWDAVQAVAALRPADLGDAADELRAGARSVVDVADSLPRPGSWSGAAAEAYDQSRKRTADHLAGATDSLHDRLAATATLADGLVDWMTRARRDLALALAEILTSTEALTLSQGPIDPAAAEDANAAAHVAARVLTAIATTYDEAADLIATADPLTTTRWS